MMAFNSFIIALLLSSLIFVAGKETVSSQHSLEEKPLIRFNSDGKLKIVNFADLHYGEAPHTDWGPAADIKSEKVIRDILLWESPEFVVFTGDQLTAEEMYPNATDYVHILYKPLVDNNYRWASVYGNHDIGPNVTRLEIFHAEQEYDLSYTAQMDASLPGVTNYYLLIYPADTDGDNPVMIWWFFDSQGGRDNDGQQPHFIDPAVIVWFEEEHSKLKELWGPLPSLVFFHIPPVEFEQIQENVPVNPLCSGLVDDDVTAQDVNTGIMETLTKAGGVQSIFVGHDHGNSWCCYYGQIQVCYNRHSGYGGYGPWTRGARVVNLDLKYLTHVNSYVILENGDIIDHFPQPVDGDTTTEYSNPSSSTSDTTTPGNSTPPDTTTGNSTPPDSTTPNSSGILQCSLCTYVKLFLIIFLYNINI